MWVDGSGHRPDYSMRDINFVRHDPVSNFICMKILLSNKIIETDEYLQEILGLSVTEYCDALEKQFS